MYIKGWLKPIFPSLGLGLLRQLQVVDFAVPSLPSDISRVSPMGNGAWGGVVVKALRYYSDGPGIDSRWCHWIFQ
jgi:hypothetical protein